MTENNEQDSKLQELQNKQQQARIKGMIKYSFELKKVGLIDSLRQNIASELTDDKDIEKEIVIIANILTNYLKKADEKVSIEDFNKWFEEHLKTFFLSDENDYKEYRNNLLNINLLNVLETKIKTGEVNVNKVRQIIKRYDDK